MKSNDIISEAGYGRNRGYRHGFASPTSPRLGYRSRDMDDEANVMYRYNEEDGRLKQRMVNNPDRRNAFAEGFRDSQEAALRDAHIIRSKFDPKKFVQKQGDKWIQVFPYGKPEDKVEEGKPGLWANIHAKRERIKHGSGEHMRKPGSKGAPTAKNFKDAASEGIEESSGELHIKHSDKMSDDERHEAIMHHHPEAKRVGKTPGLYKTNDGYLMSGIGGVRKVKPRRRVEESLTPEQQFDIIEEMVESIAQERGVDSEQVWEYFERVDDQKLFETAAWQRKEGKSKTGGLNRKGVASYRRQNPGSKLQTAVTTKPSKLKPGSKAAKRRKSFCARMSGVKGPMKKPNGKPTRKALALRKWNC